MSGSIKTMEAFAQLSNYQFINNMLYEVFRLIMKICNRHIQTKIRT